MERQESHPVLNRNRKNCKEVVEVDCTINGKFCGICCHNTEMPLTNEDVQRIEQLGYRKEEFTVVVNGIRRLRNVNGRCFFLENGKCKIYNNRPVGCRLYPAVFDGKDVVVDRICPKWRDVKIKASAKAALIKLVREIYGSG